MIGLNATWQFVFGILAQALGPILSAITPTIKSELNSLLTQLYLKALATPNVWDDFFVGLLLDILAIPRPPPPTS